MGTQKRDKLMEEFPGGGDTGCGTWRLNKIMPDGGNRSKKTLHIA
jgi:hypothetical protein